jgi:hypothetical protein
METFIRICGILPLVIMIIITIYDKNKLNFLDRKIYDDGFGNGMLMGIFFMVAFIAIICTLGDPIPTALDVYRNKTELEITYKNTTPIDSTVVWKQ